MILEPEQLKPLIEKFPDSLLIDVTTAESYAKHHLPGAVFFDYKQLVSGIAPSPGTLPDITHLSHALAQAGISPDKPIIAYDDEGGGKASRLLWTLDILGFNQLYLVNGGLHAWAQANLAVESGVNHPVPVEQHLYAFNEQKIADKSFILENLDNPNVLIWDVRSTKEYTGDTPRAARNGHIPGAINLDWIDTIDKQNGLRYRSIKELTDLLNSKGITADKTVIVHCQTHHRSAHSAILLKYLDYQNVRAYPGSWSEWGNSTDTPVEQ